MQNSSFLLTRPTFASNFVFSVLPSNAVRQNGRPKWSTQISRKSVKMVDPSGRPKSVENQLKTKQKTNRKPIQSRTKQETVLVWHAFQHCKIHHFWCRISRFGYTIPHFWCTISRVLMHNSSFLMQNLSCFDTQFLVFDAESLDFDTQFLVFDTKLPVFNAKLMFFAPSTQPFPPSAKLIIS